MFSQFPSASYNDNRGQRTEHQGTSKGLQTLVSGRLKNVCNADLEGSKLAKLFCCVILQYSFFYWHRLDHRTHHWWGNYGWSVSFRRWVTVKLFGYAVKLPNCVRSLFGAHMCKFQPCSLGFKISHCDRCFNMIPRARNRSCIFRSCAESWNDC